MQPPASSEADAIRPLTVEQFTTYVRQQAQHAPDETLRHVCQVVRDALPAHGTNRARIRRCLTACIKEQNRQARCGSKAHRVERLGLDVPLGTEEQPSLWGDGANNEP